ncbi:major facilitator superfamily domain-containing protein [Xylogone sp. PMI_703]|nr:major facilitator superfamily domain-containing protein [Xylogone sp. PMI_703]
MAPPTDIESDKSVQRHGTLDLDPLPSESPDDPLNWPVWKKNLQMFMMVIHAAMSTFSSAAVIPGFENFAELYGVSISTASYLCSVQILFLGLSPFMWNPLSKRFGRRPIFLISTFISCIMNIAGGFCKSYGSQMVTRILLSIAGCSPLGFGSAVVTELFFSHERAQKMGWWTLMVTIGIPGGPLVFGFVTQQLGVRWIFWILACINFCEFLGYLAFNAETLYDRSGNENWRPPSRNRLHFHRLDLTPLTIRDFVRPLDFAKCSRVMIPAIAFALVFTYANTAITVELPQQFGERFHFNAQQIGLQYISVIIGSGLGEQLSGPLSDMFLNRYSRRIGHRHPAHRLWIAYFGFLTAIVGIIVWGVQLNKAEPWNVTPLIGAAISNFGSQVITTTMITFAVDNYRERSADVGVFVNVVRQTWAFIGPFYFPKMYDNLGLVGGSGLLCGLIVLFGVIPTIAIHYRDRQ